MGHKVHHEQKKFMCELIFFAISINIYCDLQI